jgi:hypothetical protein
VVHERSPRAISAKSRRPRVGGERGGVTPTTARLQLGPLERDELRAVREVEQARDR